MRDLSRLRQIAIAFALAVVEAVENDRPREDDFDSERRPANVSRRAFNTTCRSGKVEGATKDGRTWSCSRAAWHTARSRKPKAPMLRLVTSDDEALAELAMNEAGLRSTRGAR
jgi:hypothetical protein